MSVQVHQVWRDQLQYQDDTRGKGALQPGPLQALTLHAILDSRPPHEFGHNSAHRRPSSARRG
jgi:hypothetical protein